MLSKEQRLTRKTYKTLIADLPKDELEKALEQVQQITKAEAKKKPLQLTAKVKIKPTKEQEEILWILSENCRLIHYFANKERKEWWDKNKHLPKKKRDKESRPTYHKQSKQLPKLKEIYPRYRQNYSKTLQDTLKQLEADYSSFHTLRKNGYEDAQPPGFKGKKYFTTIHYNQKGFKIEGIKINFTHFYPSKETKDKVDLTFEMQGKLTFTGKKVKQVTIYQVHKTKEYYLSIIYEEETPEYFNNGIYQTIDLGVMNIVAAVNSQAGKTITIKNKRVDKYWQPKIEEIQSKRDHSKKYSNRWHWYNNKMWKMIKKQANQTKDFQHKISKKIVENTKANTIIIGDLNVKAMSKSKKNDKKNDKSLHRSIQSTGSMGRFARFLTYKAEKVGKKVIRISERRTTKRCSYCMNKENRALSERIISCDCGLEIDRDVSGTVNIMQRLLALLALSQKRLVVRQQPLKEFRRLFFATQCCCPKTADSQTSNESSSLTGVVRTRRESKVNKNSY